MAITNLLILVDDGHAVEVREVSARLYKVIGYARPTPYVPPANVVQRDPQPPRSPRMSFHAQVENFRPRNDPTSTKDVRNRPPAGNETARGDRDPRGPEILE